MTKDIRGETMAESRRESNKIKCRAKILKASRRLFKAKGYENTMIEDVAEKAQVSKATLYNYFPNKESLLMGTMDDEAESFRRYIDEELKDISDIGEKIRQALTFLIWDSIPFIGVSRRILFLNACEGSHMYGKANQIENLFVPMVSEAQQQGILKKESNVDDIVEILMNIYLGSQFYWKDVDKMTEEECESKVNDILDLALSGVYQQK
ncbi:MAG: TetR/AcrR family transcriptional regulator [Clostridiales bacterium]|nr:TetR/AcrR family transcriptional regulator [Clostridiales bacterium]